MTNDYIVSLPGGIPYFDFFYTLTNGDKNYNGIEPKLEKIAETITNTLAGNKHGQYTLEGIAFSERFYLIKRTNDKLEEWGVPVEKIDSVLDLMGRMGVFN